MKLKNTIKIKSFLGSVALVAVALATSGVYAASQTDEQGFYAKLQGGYGVSGWKNGLATYNQSVPVTGDSGVSGRISAGYMFNNYLDLGVGFINGFKKTVLVKNENFLLGSNQSDSSITTRALDISLGLNVPVSDTGFGVFARMGGGYLMSSGLPTSSNALITFANSSKNNFGLMVEGGVGYSINQNLGVTLSYLQVDGSSDTSLDGNLKVKNYQPSFKNVMLGVSYLF